MRNGIVRKSRSPWASPVVLADKSDGTKRFCVDYRRLNACTKKDRYPLPRVDDSLDILSGKKYFTSLDLMSGYWQIPVAPEGVENTAFITPVGLFEFTPCHSVSVTPLVLSNEQWIRYFPVSTARPVLSTAGIPARRFADL